MLTEFIEVLRKGNVLKNPETWKNRQLVVNSLGVIVGFVVAVANAFGLPVLLDPESIAAVGGTVWAIVSLFNNWATVATTEKIGLSNPGKTDT
jgi:hypothetical protein